MKTPKGFRFAGASAGIKPHRKDVALVFSALTAIALGLLIVGQPRLRARLRRAMA